MHKNKSAIALSLLLAGVFSGVGYAQEKTDATTPDAPVHFYKLVFRVIETGPTGAILTSRIYSETISTETLLSPITHKEINTTSEIRTGDKVPIQVGAGGVKQFHYEEVGTKIDTHATTDEGGMLQTYITAEISSAAKANPDENTYDVPFVRQCTWSSRVSLPIGKPTIIFSSDNASDKGKTELELTATPVK
jgi:hypothetical protein